MNKNDCHLSSEVILLCMSVFLTFGSQRKRIFNLSAISLSSHNFSAKTVEFILSWGKISPNVSAYRSLCPMLSAIVSRLVSIRRNL